MIEKFTKTVIVLLLATSLSGCFDLERFQNFGWKPKPAFIGHAPENASPVYKKGWEQGCESGLAAYGNYYYKTFYHFTHDPELIDNGQYYKAWGDAFNYCRAYVNRYLAGGFLFGEGFNTSDPETFGNAALRSNRDIEDGGFTGFPPFMQAVSPPGWGDTSWGGSTDNTYMGYEVDN